jgi:anti-sigma factor RsiW
MQCDQYKEALMEAAASGAAPLEPVRRHVEACAHCRALLAEQHALFTAVDLGVRRSANAEIPNSFLPSVRIRLAEERKPKRSWSLAWAALAASAALIIGAVMVTRGWHPGTTLTVQQTNPNGEALRRAGEEKFSGASSEVSPEQIRRRQRQFQIDVGGVADAQPLVRAGDQDAVNQFIDRAASGEISRETLLTSEPLKRAEDLEIPRIEIATIADNPPEEASPSNTPAGGTPEMSVNTDRRTK